MTPGRRGPHPLLISRPRLRSRLPELLIVLVGALVRRSMLRSFDPAFGYGFDAHWSLGEWIGRAGTMSAQFARAGRGSGGAGAPRASPYFRRPPEFYFGWSAEIHWPGSWSSSRRRGPGTGWYVRYATPPLFAVFGLGTAWLARRSKAIAAVLTLAACTLWCRAV